MQRSDGERSSGIGRDATSLPVDRRSYLKLAGAAAGSVALLSGAASGAFTRHGIRFERTVDMVADAGCDPTGQEPCDANIRNAAADNTLLRFPPGEYRITEKNVIFDKTNLGFLGDGNVRFTVPEWFNDKMFVVERGTGLLFENIDIDLTAHGATPGVHLAADDDLQIHDVEFIGQGVNPDNDPQDCGNNQIPECATNESVTKALYPIVRSPDGTGVVRNVVARNTGYMGTYTRTGVWIGAMTEGTVRLENCRFEEFPGNGLYCSRTYGVVQVEGGAYRNNDISQVRIGSPGSYVENAVIDVDATDTGSPNPGDALNQRGVWFESRKFAGNRPEVRDCDIVIAETPNSSGGIVTASTVGDFSVRNTQIQVDVDGVRGIYGYSPSNEADSAVLRGVNVTGSAANSRAIRLRNHPDSVIENCCIQQDGASRDGIRLDNSPGTVVRNSTINVTGRQVIDDGGVRTSNISSEGSCPAPGDGGGGQRPGHALVIDGSGSRTDYTFTVSGDLEGESLTGEDTISGSTATGAVGGGRDSYRFTGELVSFALDGEANITLDGEPARVGRRPDHALLIDGAGSRTDYTFTVSGDLEGVGLSGEDSISSSTATGAVGGGRDCYGFTGELVSFELDGEANITLDGEPARVGQRPDHVLTIDGAGSRTDYRFSVSGDISATDSLSGEDTISGSTATGAVGGGRDSYRFSGELVSFELDGEANITLDGEPARVGRRPDHALNIDGMGSRTDYSFETSGDVSENSGLTGEDDISGSSASGAIGGGTDSYLFSGSIERLSLDSRARIEVDRSARTVSISGTGRYASYRLAVTGGFRRTSSLSGEDSISGGRASGAVGGGTDTYRYTGEIRELTIDDHVSVTVS